MKTLIIGSNGSMGVRYQAILAHLGQEYEIADIGTSNVDILKKLRACDNVIIASPTESHGHYLRKILPMGKNVLCEKPISKDLDELEKILTKAESSSSSFTMVMQYEHLVKPETKGTSHYNYFRSGKDGLAWDCIQIIGLAKGPVVIENTSPIWRCKINGMPLNIAKMDWAYIETIKKFLFSPPKANLELYWDIHKKTSDIHHARIGYDH